MKIVRGKKAVVVVSDGPKPPTRVEAASEVFRYPRKQHRIPRKTLRRRRREVGLLFRSRQKRKKEAETIKQINSNHRL